LIPLNKGKETEHIQQPTVIQRRHMHELTAGLPSFGDRRRRARTIGKCEAELRIKKLIGYQTFSVALVNVSAAGLGLCTYKWRPRVNQRAILYLRGEVSGISLRCRWTKHSSADPFVSGWVVDEPNDAQLKKLVELQFVNLMGDRRGNDRRQTFRPNMQRATPRRLADSPAASPLAFAPEDLPYRRSSGPADDARNDGGGQLERRSLHPIPPLRVRSNTLRMIKNCLAALRDLVALHLPRPVSVPLTPRGDFAFITHPRDLNDVQRQFPLARILPDRLLEIWLRFQWPIVGTRITGVKDRTGREIKGWVIFCPLTARQMIRNRDLARIRVLQTVKLASKMGIKIVGLGAFTSIVTRDGYDVIDRFPLHVTSGDALSAAGAVQNVAAACHLSCRDLSTSTVAIVGAAGNVGSACARILSETAKGLILVDINQKKLNQLAEELEDKCEVQIAASPEPVIKADIVIAVTNAPGAVLKAVHLRPGAVVVDAAQPKNVADKVPAERDDILVMESSIFRFPGIQYAFDLGIARGEALGCMAETIVLAAAGSKKNYSVGSISAQQVKDIYSAARLLGVKIGYFRTSAGFVSEERIRKVMEAHRFDARRTSPSVGTGVQDSLDQDTRLAVQSTIR
jgi:predicted amino acid dehydrogenase